MTENTGTTTRLARIFAGDEPTPDEYEAAFGPGGPLADTRGASHARVIAAAGLVALHAAGGLDAGPREVTDGDLAAVEAALAADPDLPVRPPSRDVLAVVLAADRARREGR